jgi:hypothetical protein
MASTTENFIDTDERAKEPAKAKLSIENYTPAENEGMMVTALYINIKDQVKFEMRRLFLSLTRTPFLLYTYSWSRKCLDRLRLFFDRLL